MMTRRSSRGDIRGALLQLPHRIGLLAGSLATLVLVSATVYNVIARYFLNKPSALAFELVEYAILYSVFLTLGWTATTDKQIVVEAFEPRGWLRGVTTWLPLAVTTALSAAMTYGSARLVRDSYFSGATMPTTLAPARWMIMWVIPFGFALMLLDTLHRVARALGDRTTTSEST